MRLVTSASTQPDGKWAPICPATAAVAPVVNEPMASYTVPGPERTLTEEFAVIRGEQAVAEAGAVAAGEAVLWEVALALGRAVVEAGA